ncbi:hypothetical protein Hanom_Chr05g00402511 [Helianthus anomalus]
MQDETPQAKEGGSNMLIIMRRKKNEPPWLQTSRLLQQPEITPPRFRQFQASSDPLRQRKIHHHRLYTLYGGKQDQKNTNKFPL